MRKTLLIVTSVAVVVAASISLIAAQHRESAAANMHMIQGLPFHHSACAAGHGRESAMAQSHVPTHLAQALGLTNTQIADIDRLAAEACEVMKRIHGEILGTLTAEQRAKIQEMHAGGHDDGAIVAFFKKLHGGR